MGSVVDKKFGRWLVIKRGQDYIYPSGKTAKRYWCRCDCGVEKNVHLAHLKNGKSKSCGCLSKELSTKHGKSHTREYKAWVNMLLRCKNPSTKDKLYGDMYICEEWLLFDNFLNDMGSCPEGYEIDRIDANRGYFKDNCRWADQQVQSSNRRKFVNNSSGKTGVVWSKSHSKWRVFLYNKRVRYEGGLFSSFEQAVLKRRELEVMILGYEKYD